MSRDNQPGWMAKQIHKIDKLDASPAQQISQDLKETAALGRTRCYVTPSSAALYYALSGPKDGYYNVLAASIKNDTRDDTMAYCIIYDSNGALYYGACSAKVLKTIWMDALSGFKTPVKLLPGMVLRVYNFGWGGGDTTQASWIYEDMGGI